MIIQLIKAKGLYSDKRLNGQIENVKFDLTKINTKTLATQLDLLSNDIKLFMKPPSSNRQYVLTDKPIKERQNIC